jgi:hypothetical protein
MKRSPMTARNFSRVIFAPGIKSRLSLGKKLVGKVVGVKDRRNENGIARADFLERIALHTVTGMPSMC